MTTTFDDRAVTVTELSPSPQEMAAGIVEVTEIVRGRVAIVIVEDERRTLVCASQVEGTHSIGASVECRARARISAMQRLEHLRERRRMQAAGLPVHPPIPVRRLP